MNYVRLGEDEELEKIEKDEGSDEFDGFPDIPSKKVFGEIVVSLEHVSKEYSLEGRDDPVCALKNIHVSRGGEFYPIRRGEFIMLRGPSGGGKTTLLNILGTIDKATKGHVEILGNVVDHNSSDEYLSEMRLEKIGFVFQSFNLLATLSAYENVELPLTILGKLNSDEVAVRTKELLSMVGLEDRMNHLPSELSGGEQQRVTIARALANEPQLLLLDEPTGDLDTRTTIEIMDLILDINLKKKSTCIMVSHNPDIECYADRIFYLEDGCFVEQVINVEQTRLVYSEYIQYVNSYQKKKSEVKI